MLGILYPVYPHCAFLHDVKCYIFTSIDCYRSQLKYLFLKEILLWLLLRSIFPSYYLFQFLNMYFLTLLNDFSPPTVSLYVQEKLNSFLLLLFNSISSAFSIGPGSINNVANDCWTHEVYLNGVHMSASRHGGNFHSSMAKLEIFGKYCVSHKATFPQFKGLSSFIFFVVKNVPLNPMSTFHHLNTAISGVVSLVYENQSCEMICLYFFTSWVHTFLGPL